MKTGAVILSVLTVLMVLSQLICGLWTESHGADPSSIAFHTQLGIGTVGVTLVTVIFLLYVALRR